MRRIAALVASVALSFGLVTAVQASPATAACKPKVTPSTIVVGTAAKTVKFNVTGCDTQSWTLYANDFSFIAYESAPSDTFIPGEYNLSNADAGTQAITVHAYNSDFEEYEFQSSVKIKRDTRIVNFNAGPEPIDSGKKLRFTADLQRVNWNTGTWKAYGSQTVQLQRKIPGSTYKNWGGPIKIGSNGHLIIDKTVTKTASYRLVYAGNSVSDTATGAGDYVLVNRIYSIGPNEDGIYW